MQIGPIGIFLFSGPWASYALWGVIFWSGFGRYWGGVKIATVFLKKLGSDLVVQSSRQGYPEQNLALYYLGRFSSRSVRGGFLLFFGAVLGGSKLETHF